MSMIYFHFDRHNFDDLTDKLIRDDYKTTIWFLCGRYNKLCSIKKKPGDVSKIFLFVKCFQNQFICFELYCTTLHRLQKNRHHNKPHKTYFYMNNFTLFCLTQILSLYWTQFQFLPKLTLLLAKSYCHWLTVILITFT